MQSWFLKSKPLYLDPSHLESRSDSHESLSLLSEDADEVQKVDLFLDSKSEMPKKGLGTIDLGIEGNSSNIIVQSSIESYITMQINS